MSYTLRVRELQSKTLVRSESYSEMETARVAAEATTPSGIGPIEVTVIDPNGVQVFIKVEG